MKEEFCMNLIQAIDFGLITMKKYMMIGYYCEKYHIMIDFNQKGIFGVNMVSFYQKFF